jgi:hypothetical protein
MGIEGGDRLFLPCFAFDIPYTKSGSCPIYRKSGSRVFVYPAATQEQKKKKEMIWEKQQIQDPLLETRKPPHIVGKGGKFCRRTLLTKRFLP